MPPPNEIMTPVEVPDMSNLAMIQAMRATTDSVKLLTDSVKELRDEVKEERATVADVRERLIRMEAANLSIDVKELQTKVTAIEATLAEQRGAAKLGDWLRNFAPWILACVGVAAALAKGIQF